MNIFLYVIYGLIIGFVGGYAGISGAPILIVFLTLISGFSQHLAQGTSLAIMLGPMSFMGVWYMRDILKKYIKHAIVGFILYALFSYVGGWMAYQFDSQSLKRIFSVFIFIIGVVYVFRSLKTNVAGYKKCKIIHVAILSIFVGIIGGFLGIGAGVLFVPILSTIFKVEKNIARAISLAILLPPVSLGAVIKYSSMGDINWIAAIIIFISYFTMNYVGAKIGTGHSHRKFGIVFGVFLSAIGIINFYIL